MKNDFSSDPAGADESDRRLPVEGMKRSLGRALLRILSDEDRALLERLFAEDDRLALIHFFREKLPNFRSTAAEVLIHGEKGVFHVEGPIRVGHTVLSITAPPGWTVFFFVNGQPHQFSGGDATVTVGEKGTINPGIPSLRKNATTMTVYTHPAKDSSKLRSLTLPILPRITRLSRFRENPARELFTVMWENSAWVALACLLSGSVAAWLSFDWLPK